MKSPAFSLYVRDFLCSQTVSKLHSKSLSKDAPNILARAFNAYFFLLLNSWLQVPRATLPDDDTELADLARVTPEEWVAIKPLLMPVLERDASGRLFNDRLMSESKKQENRGISGSKGGSKKQANKVANNVAALATENATENATEQEQRKSKSKGTREELRAYLMEIGCPTSDGDHLFDGWEANGWKRGQNKILDWKAAARNWKTSGWLPSQKQNKNGAQRLLPESNQVPETIAIKNFIT